MLQETWLNNKVELTIPNYSCLRQDRQNVNSRNPHGGVLIFIHKSLSGKSVKFCVLKHIEAIFINIKVGSFAVTIGSIYSSASLTRAQSKEDLSKLLSQPAPFIQAGDFNAKHSSWNNAKNCRKGEDLVKICTQNLCSVNFPDEPTLYPATGDPSIVDFVLTKGVIGMSKPITINVFSSDHLPISFDFPFSVGLPAEVKIKNYSKANWKVFREKLSSSLEAHVLNGVSMENSEMIDYQIRSLNKCLLTASSVSVPMKKPYLFRYPTSDEIEILKKKRNLLRRNAQISPLNKSEINRLNREIKRKTASLNSSSFGDKLATLSVENLSLFQFAKSIKKKHKPIPPLLNTNDEIIFQEKQKSQLIADSFKKSHDIPLTPTRHSEKVAEAVSAINLGTFNINNSDKIHLSEVVSLIENLNPKKACGYDDINNRLLKNMPTRGIDLITLIFNACLKLAYFPVSWKIGKVVAIGKPGKDSKLASSYRPITLLPVIGKIFEKTILHRLQEIEEDKKIFIPQQFGFRPKHSTTHQICRLVKTIKLRFTHKKSTAMAMIDIEKAFDSVWHHALLFKLKSNGIPMYLLKIIASFLSDRESFVSINGNNSETFKIPAGVPQGSPLSPHLFNHFINDIPIPKNCKLAIYADDTAIISSAKNNRLSLIVRRINRGLKQISDHFTDWKIKLNHTKTESILFSRSPKTIKQKDDHHITLNNISIEWKNLVTYLGFNLDPRLTSGKHIDISIQKAKKAISILYCLLRKNCRVNNKAKITLYRSYIRPILTYACPVFANCAKTHMRKLQVTQNKCLRMALNAPFRTRIATLHELANVPTVVEFVDKLTGNFLNGCEYSNNNLIRNLGLN